MVVEIGMYPMLLRWLLRPTKTTGQAQPYPLLMVVARSEGKNTLDLGLPLQNETMKYSWKPIMMMLMGCCWRFEEQQLDDLSHSP